MRGLKSIIVWVCCGRKGAVNDGMKTGRNALELRARSKQYVSPGFKMELGTNGANELDSDQTAGTGKDMTVLQLELCKQLWEGIQAEPLNLTRSLFGQDSHNTIPSNLELKWKLPLSLQRSPVFFLFCFLMCQIGSLSHKCQRLQFWLKRTKSENYHICEFSYYRARNHSTAYTIGSQIQFKKYLPKVMLQKSYMLSLDRLASSLPL